MPSCPASSPCGRWPFSSAMALWWPRWCGRGFGCSAWIKCKVYKSLLAPPQDLQAIKPSASSPYLWSRSVCGLPRGSQVNPLPGGQGFQGLSGARLPDRLCHLSGPDPDPRVLDSAHHHPEPVQCSSVWGPKAEAGGLHLPGLGDFWPTVA